MKRALRAAGRPLLAGLLILIAARLLPPAAAAARDRRLDKAPEGQAPRPAPTPADLFRTSYDWVETADSFLRQGLPDEAFEAYLDALAGYEQLARDHPAWNPDVVDFRLRYCRRQLEHILAGRPQPEPEAGPRTNAWTGIEWSSSLLEDVPDIQPNGLDSNLKTAAAREQAGDLEQALALYEKALALKPSSLPAAQGAGRCCLRLGLWKRGRDHLLAAFAQAPDDLDTLLLLASIACAERDFSRALHILAPAALRYPDQARIRFLLGSAYMGQGQLDRAESEWRQAVTLDPRLSEAHYNLARLLLIRNPPDLAGAREHYQLSLKAGGERDDHLEKVFSSIPIKDISPAPAAGPATNQPAAPKQAIRPSIPATR